MRNHQGRPVQLANHIRNRECFARTGDAEERLVAISGFDRLNQLGNGLALVAARFVVRFELKSHPPI